MNVEREIVEILDGVLSLNGRGLQFTGETPLLGVLPELDSMAVLGVITALEERFAFVIHDDEIDGAVFATVGSLTAFAAGKLAGL